MSFFYVLILFCIGTVSANQLIKIGKITGPVENIEIGPDSNIYIASQNRTFYVLNPEHEIVSQTYIGASVLKILITPGKYLWVISTHRIYLLNENFTIVNDVKYSIRNFHRTIPRVFFTDQNGNLIYNSAEGVAMLKLTAITPILILNLENFFIGDETAYIVDSSNHIYLTGTLQERDLRDRKPNQYYEKLALIYSNELENQSPSAMIRDGPSRTLDVYSSILTEFDRYTIVGYSGDHARLLTTTSNFLNDKLSVIYSQPSFKYYNFYTLKNYFYFLGKNEEGDCFLNFGTKSSDESSPILIKQINRVFEETLCSSTKILSKSDGTLFLASDVRLYKLKAGDAEVVDINPFNKNKYKDSAIFSLALDKNENLWILGKDDLYFLDNNSETADRVTNSPLYIQNGILKIHNKTGELFVGSENGLYVFLS